MVLALLVMLAVSSVALVGDPLLVRLPLKQALMLPPCSVSFTGGTAVTEDGPRVANTSDFSRQAEPPKKEAAAAGPQVKRADEWKDPWRRSKSPKKKLGVSVSPSRARRRRKTSASSASASNSSR